MSGYYGGARPGSYYDNFGEAGEDAYTGYEDDKYDRLRNEMLGYERAKSPTQTISLLTTVPQNITATNIAGKHAPTRNSLRHSRMIVMHRTGTVPSKSTPPVLRFYKLATALVGLQTFIAVTIGFIAFWVYLWTPNIRTRDNPFWSGAPLFFSGVVGLLLLCCYRKEYPGEKNGFCAYSVKVLSVFLSTVAGTACLIAFSFALLHLLNIQVMECGPSSIQFNETCLCNIASNTTMPFFARSYHYIDLQCPDLNNLFILLLIFSCVTNFVGAVLALWYVYLHWSSRYLYTYSKVHTDSLRPTVISNN